MRHGTREFRYPAEPDNRRILVSGWPQLMSGVGNCYRESNIGEGGLTDLVKLSG